ncbi:MAG: protein kinase, partial [Ruminiclostridium sp.]|nr:protein kinase [Ruminiclostridium sp.]
MPYEGAQIVPMEDNAGYYVYLLSPYRKSLARHFRKYSMTHLQAVNLGLDLCASLAVCRQAGYLYIDLKPENIFISEDNEYRIGDLGFVKTASLAYASVPDKYCSQYTAPEISGPMSSINQTIDIYAVGMILYQAYNGGTLPFSGQAA